MTVVWLVVPDARSVTWCCQWRRHLCVISWALYGRWWTSDRACLLFSQSWETGQCISCTVRTHQTETNKFPDKSTAFTLSHNASHISQNSPALLVTIDSDRPDLAKVIQLFLPIKPVTSISQQDQCTFPQPFGTGEMPFITLTPSAWDHKENITVKLPGYECSRFDSSEFWKDIAQNSYPTARFLLYLSSAQ